MDSLVQRIETLLEADKLREAFESWYVQKYLGVNIGDAFDRHGDGYIRLDVHYVWLGWKALSELVPMLDLLRVVAVQAEALEKNRRWGAALPFDEESTEALEQMRDVEKSIEQALTESAPLVELAKRMEVV